MVDVARANATFHQLLNDGSLQLANAADELLNISDVDSVQVIKPVKLIVAGQFDPVSVDNLATNLTGQLSTAMDLPLERFVNVSVVAGQLFDARTNISTDVLQLSTNLLLDYNDKDAKMSNLSQLVANKGLTLRDLNDSLMLVPS